MTTEDKKVELLEKQKAEKDDDNLAEEVLEKKILEDEVNAAFEEEFGHDWLADKPAHVRAAVNLARLIGVLLALNFFLVALGMMGDAFTAIAGISAGKLFGGVSSPIVGLMVGIIATVLVQSSSTTTSIIVVLVGNGLVDVSTAIPMIMGANIGTSVTNTIVSLGFADDSEAYRRGFAGATVHDMFNYLNVLVLLPLELLVSALRGEGHGGLLQTLAERTGGDYEEGTTSATGDNYKEANPIKKITTPFIEKLIHINKDVVEDAAQGFPALDDVDCAAGLNSNFKFENKHVELALCPDDEGEPAGRCDFCPGGAFNETVFAAAEEAFEHAHLIDEGRLGRFGDTGGGVIALILSLVMLIGSLAVIVKILTAVVKGPARTVLIKTLNYNFVGGGAVSIIVGCLITICVQSSSITTSVLTPLVAVGTLSLENMFPFTLGANIGTTATGLIAAAAAGKQAGFVIALVHLYFNVVGTVIWYPIPFMRNIPLKGARFLGEMAAIMKIFPVIYIIVMFLVYPLVFFGLSLGFSGEGVAGKVISSILLVALLGGHLFVAYWYKKLDGKSKFVDFVAKREAVLAEKKAAKAAAAAAKATEANVGAPPEEERSL